MSSPTRPGLTHVFTIEAAISAPSSGGNTVRGERLHIPITGGTISGPKLSGTVLPGGSDWPLIRSDGTSEISAIYTIKADDGTLILVRNDGLRVSTEEVTARLRAGERVEPDEYYFRTIPRFEAPAGPHEWLNNRIFVASIAPSAGKVTIDVYSLD
jgi:hypothetical protein